ncbi:hypothetical protein CNEONATNEC26_01345 [Clostridium neonatale]|nr:hypothetical protein [Clostridium neonatale]SUQ47064.1 hypothetical protein CNEONATNEC26_01345 [Clostridium neonatale]
MNKSNNKRYQITDEKIENALLTLLKIKTLTQYTLMTYVKKL